MKIEYIVKHAPTKSIFGFCSKEEAKCKALELNRFYKIANRMSKTKAQIISIESYLEWCKAEDLSLSEALRFDNIKI